MGYFKEHKKGIIGTIIFHGALIVLLILLGFHTPFPLPGEEGILVNFGTSETGSGSVEPAPTQVQKVEEQQEEVPEKVEKVVEQNNNAPEEIIDQNFEEAAAIESGKKEEKKKPEKTPEQIEQERLEKERIEKERLEEIERQKKLEQERLEKERQEKQAQEINDKIGKLFSSGKGEKESEGQGLSGGEGNQGKENGSVNSNNYGEGHGLGDKGISYSLSGRSAVYLPKIEDNSQKEGIVVVDIKVDSQGNVIWANPGARGSTTLDAYLLKLAKDAALKVKFNTKPNAPDQVGTITIRFELE